MSDARILAWVMANPARAGMLDAQGWTKILTMALGERMLGSLAARLQGIKVPESAERVLERARLSDERERTQALWEAEMCRRALASLNVKTVLLKGTAFVAADLMAGQGRVIGDLDILVPRDRLDEVENALLAAGWVWVKDDEYDQAYYRDHMHELPPMIHDERDRMIDVHHTILPLTARVTPDAAALLEDAVRLESGLYVLSPEDMIVHAVAHMFADGDLAGGLRNLWDIHCLILENKDKPDFWTRLRERGLKHGLMTHVSRALRMTHHIYETPVDSWLAFEARRADVLYAGCILARNGWGRETRKLLRFAFYVRSHWIRMPPLMLARHLFTKWRKGNSTQAG